MINFTVGPVQSNEKVLAIGAEQTPYFRTDEFSELMLENESIMLSLANAPVFSRAVFITGSGTASMEATIMNTLTEDDKCLVVNGGSFGARFVQLLKLHEIPFTEIKLDYGKPLTKELLSFYENCNYTAFLINIHETSTGVLYDLGLISGFCERNNLFLIVDAISAFLTDPIDMATSGIDVLITGSQKALACPPGVSIIVLSPEAIKRVKITHCNCLYLDLGNALLDGERGQTPFTPAVSILRQIHSRLLEIKNNGGASVEIERVSKLANYFRSNISELPLQFYSESMSNAVTALHPTNVSANDVFFTLMKEYNIWICPNGGDLKDSVFRVGHIGCLSYADYDCLLDAFNDMYSRGLL